MSSEPRFARLSVTTIVVLALVAVGLGVLNSTQGPKVSFAEVNESALTSRAGQRILLHANQPLRAVEADDVTVSPAAEVEVSVDRNTVMLRFAETLHYNTKYSVSVETSGSTTGATGALTHSFTTPDVDVFSLVRGTAEQPDQVLRHTLSTAKSNEALFQAPRIQEYLALGDLIAAVTLDDLDVPALVLASPSEGVSSVVDTGGVSTLRQLRAADSGDLFGYIADDGFDGDIQSALMLFDVRDSSGLSKRVTGIGGAELSVADWAFVPGTTSIVVQGTDQYVLLVDTLNPENPTPLGRHSELRGFIPGTTQLVVANRAGVSVIDLSSGTTTPLELPDFDLDERFYPGKAMMLDDASVVQLYTELTDDSTTAVASALFLAGPDGTRELYRTPAESHIRNFCLSPNGEYLAVEVVGTASETDGYPVVPGFSSSSVYFVPLDDGFAVRGVNGFLPNWCLADS